MARDAALPGRALSTDRSTAGMPACRYRLGGKKVQVKSDPQIPQMTALHLRHPRNLWMFVLCMAFNVVAALQCAQKEFSHAYPRTGAITGEKDSRHG
jgi:hypothetical protein